MLLGSSFVLYLLNLPHFLYLFTLSHISRAYKFAIRRSSNRFVVISLCELIIYRLFVALLPLL